MDAIIIGKYLYWNVVQKDTDLTWQESWRDVVSELIFEHPFFFLRKLLSGLMYHVSLQTILILPSYDSKL